MKEEFKLSDYQINVLSPIIEQKNKAEVNLQNALLLIVGEPFNSFKIENGILTIDKNPVIEG